MNTPFEEKIGKFCFHEKREHIIYKVVDGDEDHVILEQVWPKPEDDNRHHEYPMRYFNNHFIATEPKR
jgi:hypothetical protein